MTKIKFICSKCGKESWFKVNLKTCVITITDLLCDTCNPITEEDE